MASSSMSIWLRCALGKERDRARKEGANFSQRLLEIVRGYQRMVEEIPTPNVESLENAQGYVQGVEEYGILEFPPAFPKGVKVEEIIWYMEHCAEPPKAKKRTFVNVWARQEVLEEMERAEQIGVSHSLRMNQIAERYMALLDTAKDLRLSEEEKVKVREIADPFCYPSTDALAEATGVPTFRGKKWVEVLKAIEREKAKKK